MRVVERSEKGAAPPDPPRPPTWALDILAALFVIGFAYVADPFREYLFPSPSSVGASVFAAAMLPFRRRWPISVVFVVTILFAVVALAEGTLNLGLEIAIAIAVFGVGFRRELRIGLIVTVSAITAAVLAAVSVTGSLFDPRLPQLVFVIAFFGAAGDAARMHRGYIAAIKERAVRAERTRDAEARRRVTEERLRIARDLHDAVAHEIAMISLNAGVASQTLEVDPVQAQESLTVVRRASRSVLGEIGDLLELLRAEEESQGEPDAHTSPQPGLDRLDQLVARFGTAGLAVSTRVEGDLSRVPARIGRVAYRVVQEALTNAYKHGTDQRAHLLLHAGEPLLDVVVTNPVDGTSDDKSQADAVGSEDVPNGRGFGIAGLREQVASVRGTVETGLGPGGWRVAASLPYADSGDSEATA